MHSNLFAILPYHYDDKRPTETKQFILWKSHIVTMNLSPGQKSTFRKKKCSFVQHTTAIQGIKNDTRMNTMKSFFFAIYHSCW